MQRRGWQVEVWGVLGFELPGGVIHRTYTNPAELRRLAIEYPCDVVALPAIWPETFSFTTFEAALDVGAPIVVGPYGNPAELVRTHGIGLVLEELTSNALIAALEAVIADRTRFSGKLKAFELEARRFQLDNYLEQIYAHRTQVRTPGPLGIIPTPAIQRAPRAAPPAESPLRHLLADQTNALLKTRIPMLHTYSKKLGAWVSKSGAGRRR